MMLNKDKREAEYPPELESQFILRLPEKPAVVLKDTLKKGEDLNDRLTIKLESDMRHGEVCLDQWKMHAKIVDLPTITESVKTIDRKSFYKTADICQMMICSEEPDNPSTEDESPKNKKKDPYKVDKKYLWPHGITPPTKNIRKRRFRKTLKKKSVEAPEIEKEVKRLLRADNEAISITWEIINEEDEQNLNSATSSVTHAKIEKKGKAERSKKQESNSDATHSKSSSNIVDIFGGAVSDSDLDEENINIDLEDCHLSAYDIRLSGTNSLIEIGEPSSRRDTLPLEFGSPINQTLLETNTTKKKSNSKRCETQTSSNIKCGGISSEDDGDYQSRETSSDDMTVRIEQLKIEVDEMKEKRQKMRLEIEGMENIALRKRFQDILHKLNQDIMYKEMQYQGMITLQNSEDI